MADADPILTVLNTRRVTELNARARRVRSGRPIELDAIFHVDGPRFFEPQLSLQFFALFERLPQIHEHDVVAVGSEFDLLAPA